MSTRIFNMDADLLRELSTPLPGTPPRIDATKMRRLYLQASSQQWFPPERLDFQSEMKIDPEVGKVWGDFGTIFYTLELMGLNVLDRMVGSAVSKLESQDAAYYLSTQCSDEARHVFLIESYLRRLGREPRREKKYLVLGKAASMGFYRVENWLFSTLFSESFASAFLRHAQKAEIDDFGREMCKAILSDEHRHVHFLYLVLPSVIEDLSLLGKAYVKSAQYFILKFTETMTRTLAKDGAAIGIRREDLLEESFENVRKAYEQFGMGRDFLRFPSIRSA